MSYTDNPVADYARYDAAQAAKEDKLPKCRHCGFHIQDEHLYDINEGAVCSECLIKHYHECPDDDEETICGCCDKRIEEDFIAKINNEYICDKCIDEHIKKRTEDYVC